MLDQLRGLDDLSGVDGIPALSDLFVASRPLQTRCKVIAVNRGSDFAAFEPLLEEVVPESGLELMNGEARKRLPSTKRLIEIGLDDNATEIKQQCLGLTRNHDDQPFQILGSLAEHSARDELLSGPATCCKVNVKLAVMPTARHQNCASSSAITAPEPSTIPARMPGAFDSR